MLLLLISFSCVSECEKGFDKHEDGLCYQTGEADTGGVGGGDSGSGGVDSDDSADDSSEDSADDSADDSASDSASDSADSGGGDSGSDTGEPDAVDLDDLLDDLPGCEPWTDDGRLDIRNGCIDGACAGMSAREVLTALGPQTSSYQIYIESGSTSWSTIYYEWDNGVTVAFSDADLSGAVDATEIAGYITAELPWDGGSVDGLGLGASLSCFIDVYGRPDNVNFSDTSDGYQPYYMYWNSPGFTVSDTVYNATGSAFVWDGLADRITLYGP